MSGTLTSPTFYKCNDCIDAQHSMRARNMRMRLTGCSFKTLQGGFQSEMTRREAAQILGVRESAAEDRVKDAHRKLMVSKSFIKRLK